MIAGENDGACGRYVFGADDIDAPEEGIGNDPDQRNDQSVNQHPAPATSNSAALCDFDDWLSNALCAVCDCACCGVGSGADVAGRGPPAFWPMPSEIAKLDIRQNKKFASPVERY